LPYQVHSIRPKHSSAIELGKLTVLVGPNNCGKSQTLKDIREYSSTGSTNRLVVLDEVNSSLPTLAELKAAIQIGPNSSAVDHVMITGVKDDLLTQMSFGPHGTWLDNNYNAGSENSSSKRELLRQLGTCLFAYLGAEARFKLTTQSPGFDTRSEAPSNAIQSLFKSGPDTHAELRRAFRSAFNMDIGLDWAAMTRFYLRVSEDFGDIPDGRIALDELMRDAADLEKQGDGFRSFAGIALALLTFPTRLLLLDEPEAFLHPAQSRVLGRWLATQASRRQAQVIVATHSSDFLAGLIASSEDATILRLNRNNTSTNFHRIPPTATLGLIQSPLLSSQPVLDSLFHRGVIVCEGDPDRAIYQTTAHKFLADCGGEDVLFIHSNGKDALKSPVELLRQSGTPVCVIADFDVINSEALLDEIALALNGNPLSSDIKTLRTHVSTAIEERSQEQSLGELRDSVHEWLEHEEADLRRARRNLVSKARTGSNKWEKAKKKGVACLPAADIPKANELIQRLAEIGLFVVPCGELESWMDLQKLKGKGWNQAALQELYSSNCPPALREFVGRTLSFLAQR